jgi:hypothetical protein
MESLIVAILDAVFASLAESVGVSDWLRDRLGRDPEKLAFRAALTQALADAGEHFPGRDLRYFAEMLRDFGGPLLFRTLQPATPLPTTAELTAAWLAHLNLDSVIYYRTDFERFAAIFLTSLQNNIENQQPLQWIAQLRTQKMTTDAVRRSADAAEESVTRLAALQAQLQQLTERLEQQSHITTSGGAVNMGRIDVGGNFVGRDQITIRNYFTNGLGRLHIDYSARIEEFLLEYLGSRRKHVPFGGRATQLAALDAWLHDRTAPPYYLMTAEAGRGKSALVCRWQTQILTRPDVEVIFLPISIRFETATQDVLFAALAARLAAIYGEEMQTAALSADQWRAICQSFLRRTAPDQKQLVVILDGLDEATGWTPGRGLFPGDPPAGLRVLVTARQRAGEVGPEGWATTLGWQDGWLACKEMLHGLDRTGVQEALASMGNPLDRLATQVDVVGELFRLTEGDPLLVRLYVDALVGQGAAAAYLRAEELKTLQAGLHGYFDRWWDEQHQQWTHEGRDPLLEQAQLRTLLNTVAAASGPLTQDDLAAVSGLADGILVRRLLQTVSRWLIGDGKSHGYTFSHPRLGYYFWEQLGQAERADWDARFTAWGATTLAALNSGAVAPKATPRYLVQHYAAHLTRAHAPAEQFYALLSDDWRQAWEEVDVTYSGFLNDISSVEAKAQAAYRPKQPGKAEAIVQQIKAALCRVSISALGDNLTPELLRLALIHNLRTPTQIIAMIRLMHDEHKRSVALAASADHLPVELVAEALTITRGIGYEGARVHAMGALAPHLPEAQQSDVLTEALAAARGIRYESDRARALEALAPHLPPALLTEALAVARGIGYESYRARALGALAPHLPEAQQPDLLTEALAAARGIKYESDRARVLGALAPNLPEAQQPAVLTEALAAARGSWYKSDLARALGALAPHLPEAQQPDVLTEALAEARGIRSESDRASALGALAPHLPEAQQPAVVTEALASARGIGFESHRADALSALAPHLPPALLTEALAAARGIRSESDRANALGVLAPHLPEAQQPALLTEALAAARRIGFESYRAWALGALAPHLPEAQQPEMLTEALAAAKGIGNESDLADALSALAPHLPPALLTEALAVARRIGYESARAWVLAALAPHLPPALLTEALTAARGIRSESDRASALTALAPHLPEAQQPAVLTEALAAARGIRSESARARALTALAPRLPEAQQPELLTEALAVARGIRSESDRASALGALAPHLPPALLTEALAAARGIGSESDRASALGVLAPHLPEAQQPEVLTEALTAARGIRNESHRARALAALAPHLPEAQQPEMLTEALEVARGIWSESDRAWALSALAPHLPEAQQSAVLTEALAATRGIRNESDRTDALSALAPHLTAWSRKFPETAYLEWTRTLHQLSSRPRPQFLYDIQILMPFTLALADEEASQAAAGIFHALRDVCAWWP